MSGIKAKHAQKSISAGALPQTPLGEVTALPRPPSWNKGDLLLREGRGAGEGEEREGKAGEEKWPQRWSERQPRRYEVLGMRQGRGAKRRGRAKMGWEGRKGIRGTPCVPLNFPQNNQWRFWGLHLGAGGQWGGHNCS